MADDSAVVVLTRESAAEILLNGGVGGLALQPRHARKQRYVVCVRNDRNHNPGSGEPHRTAFLIGTISGMEVSGARDGMKRWRILFDSVARVSLPDVWQEWRNPVIYKNLGELGIDPASLDFSRSERGEERREPPPLAAEDGHPLTIAQAKARLARSLGVRPEQIEITVRA